MALWKKRKATTPTQDRYTPDGEKYGGFPVYNYQYKDPHSGQQRTIILAHVFTERDGVKVFEFINPLQMSTDRHLQMTVALEQVDWGMDKETLLGLLDKMEGHINDGKITKCVEVLNDMRYRAKELVEEKTALHLAAVLFIRETEEAHTYNDIVRKQKLRDWSSDPETKAFFLAASFRMLSGYSGLSVEDSQAYIEDTKERQTPKSDASASSGKKKPSKNRGAYGMMK